MRFDSTIFIRDHEISFTQPSYFIADIAANHDGNVERAKELIWLAKKSGANAVKFQHFTAEKIVSDYGFKELGGKKAHQTGWKKSVFDIYKQYECDTNWTSELIKTSVAAGVDFLTTPYDFDVVDKLDEHLPAYKIGSGDITWIEFISYVAKRNKPVLLATGASNMQDVRRAVNELSTHNSKVVLMQCNTNYTGSLENFKHINLRVLNAYAKEFPGIILGLSDHSPGHATVLGAIALGARVIEKHFTDDVGRIGPDHAFSMNSQTWQEMVDRSRELEYALGNDVKEVEENEQDSAVVQQRSLRLKRDLLKGELISKDDIDVLRPAPPDACKPYMADLVVNRRLNKLKLAGDAIYLSDFETL
jgi:sialic acid synthase SpsE